MEIYDITEYIEATINNYLNSKKFEQIINNKYNVKTTTNRWEITNKDSSTIKINITLDWGQK